MIQQLNAADKHANEAMRALNEAWQVKLNAERAAMANKGDPVTAAALQEANANFETARINYEDADRAFLELASQAQRNSPYPRPLVVQQA